MKYPAKNSIHSIFRIQKNTFGRFLRGSKNSIFKIALLVFGFISTLGSTHALFNGTVGIDIGFSTKSPIEFNDTVRAIIEQPDGKILIGGAFTIYSGVAANNIIRLNADGSVDTGFVTDAGFNNTVRVFALQSDGKILVGGDFTTYKGVSTKYIVRLNSDGSKDDTFIVGSSYNAAVYDIKLQSDGKMVTVGNFTTYSGVAAAYIARLNSDGTRDTGFTIGTAFNTVTYSAVIQSDGKIIVGGNFTSYSGSTTNRIIRLNTNGTKDTSFTIGAGLNAYAYTLLLQSDGKILVGGNYTTYAGVSAVRLIRLNTDGTRDTSFVSTGCGAVVYSVGLQSDGKILVGGAFTTYRGVAKKYIMRVNSDGSIDNTFAIGNGFDGSVYALAIQASGKIIAGGTFTQYQSRGVNKIIRLNTDGSKDDFIPGYGFNATIQTQAKQSDGKILVGGNFTTYSGLAINYLARLNTDGSLDSGFLIGGGFDGEVSALALQSDGKIIAGGTFTTYSGVSANNIIRLNSDGTKDATFGIGTAFNGSVYDIKIQGDGKIIVVGDFTTYSGASSPYIIRLNSDGTRDTSFTIGTGFNAYVRSAVIQSDGKIIVGGNFTSYSGSTTNRIIRLNTNGTKDTSFTIGAGLNAYAYILLLQSDGKILVGGNFTTYSGATNNRIVRLNTDGTKDDTFVMGAGFNAYVQTLSLQSDGKILVGGNFTTYAGNTTNYLARLTTSGSYDTTFTIGGGFDGAVYTLDASTPQRILAGGNFRAYDSVPVGFFTQLYEIQPPMLISPSMNITREVPYGDLSWTPSASTGIFVYKYQIARNYSFTDIFSTGTTSATGIFLTGLMDGSYYRRVLAYDTVGNEGGWSSIGIFDVDVSAPVLTWTGATPIDNAWIENNSFLAQIDITETFFHEFKWIWGGTQYSLYDSGLIFMMNFDKVDALGETDGYIQDISQYANNGSGYGGITRTGEGKWNGAYRFDGIDDHIEIDWVYTGGYAYTMGGWLKYTESKSNPGFLTFTDSDGNRRDMYLYNDTALRIFTYNGTATYYTTPKFSALNDGKRHYVMAVYDGTNAPWVFIDGIIYTTNTPTSTTSQTSNKIKIGLLNNGSTLPAYHFNGMIDEVRIYNRALSQEEISLLYNSNLNKYDTNKRNFSIKQYNEVEGSYMYTGLVSDNTRTTGIGRNITRGDVYAPTLTWTGATPADNAWIENNSFTAQIDITEGFLKKFSRYWNGEEYILYDSGLLLMYNFDNIEDLGENKIYIKDISSSNNNGSGYGGVVWTETGKWNGGYYFDGSNDYIQSDWTYSGYTYTMGGWIKYTAAKTSPGLISFTDSDGYRRDIYINNATAARMFTYNGTARYYTTPTFTSLNDGQRHHVMAVYDGTNAPWAFIDGVKYTGANATNVSTYPAGRMRIGALNIATMSSDYYFNGTIDEVRMYNRALSDDEVILLYNSNLRKYAPAKRELTILQTGLVEGVEYRYTGSVNDTVTNVETGRTIGFGTPPQDDTTGPTFTFANNSGPECSAGILTIANAADTGVGLHETSPYSFDGIAWNTTADIVITAQQPGAQVRTGRVRDILDNRTSHAATYTFTNVTPTADDFTGSATVGNTAKSVNRKTLSHATEGSCSADDIVYDSIHSQGTKGVCSVVGDIITYTPDADQVGSDACTLRIKDNETTTKDIIVSRGAIDTSKPSAPLLLFPTSGTSLTTGTVTLLRSGSTDLGAGLSGYLWQLSTGSNFATLISGGFTSMTGITILGLSPATYYRRVYTIDLFGNTGDRSSSRNFIIAPAISFVIESPASLALGTISVPETTQIIEKTFTQSEEYFTLSDYLGADDGYYTTLSMSNLTDGNGHTISNNNIAIKSATSVVTLEGGENPRVVSAITGAYRTFGNDVLTFIKRDTGTNGGVIGSYGVAAGLKLTVPELQEQGNYAGTLIYTIYPN